MIVKEDIVNLIDNELENINPTLEDIYSDNISNQIDNLITQQNEDIEHIEYKNKLLGILDNLKEMGVELNYSKEMSIEELEKIIDKIKA